MSRGPYRFGFGLLLAISIGSLLTQTVICQTERLGAVSYTPPKGWTRTVKENTIVFHEVKQATGTFCFITLYGATPSAGNPQANFFKEWNNLVVKPWGAEANPKTETTSEDGWIVIAGGGAVDFQGNKALALLNVISGFGITVSVLAILNTDAYLPQVTAFVSGLTIDKSTAAPGNSVVSGSAAPRIEDGKLVIPLPTRPLTIADLAGEWGQNDGITTTYVDRYTGAYAGFESLHFTDRMTITAKGEYFSDFFALQNGRKIKEKSSGTVSINGRVLVIAQNNVRKYVVRGWLELPDITILEVCGPWYDDDVIPSEIFSNPEQGANLNKRWVRKK